MEPKKKRRVAIFGATGHIGKNIVLGLYKEFELTLFARSQEKLEIFMNNNKIISKVRVLNFELFMEVDFDIIINCIGIGDPGKLKTNISSVFFITEKYDNMILIYLENNPDSLYINFSSGAAYLSNFEKPSTVTTQTNISINKLTPADCYGISKINSEAKHRILDNFNIVDLRIFGFFSRHIDVNSNFFMTDLIRCLYYDEILVTSSEDIMRDYVHPADLVSLIILIADKKSVNDVYDVYSLQPTTKFKILEEFSARYGLRYEYNKNTNLSSVTGNKHNYFTQYVHAQTLGFSPKFDSITTIIDEYDFMKDKIIF
ncbi:NAD(P)-dependent oxidoreductase [Paenibacillus sp. N3.4]|uniref:NAD-dependent epimerase/dehydratase family protein n=1 Tax=Paenibacillus sp. N3.4 TaxID=2603222 RepID=UPI001C9CF2A6|nr:NAD(P)-dependent oxidoreductase [Paenibacillus sp. N3.4]